MRILHNNNVFHSVQKMTNKKTKMPQMEIFSNTVETKTPKEKKDLMIKKTYLTFKSSLDLQRSYIFKDILNWSLARDG